MAVEALAQDAAARAGISLNLDLPREPLELSLELDQCVYRIAQEALENVVHHAQATRVGVSLTMEGDRLTLVVHDDGQGFDLTGSDQTERYGLRGMQERARMVGGRLRLQSVPQAGTTVTLLLKVHDDTSPDL